MLKTLQQAMPQIAAVLGETTYPNTDQEEIPD
jgi:hypothetical protein